MSYEYEVQTDGGSSFDNLAGFGGKLQDALNGEEAASRLASGWELWQANTLSDSQGVNGFVLIYRRAKS